ncbi:MAG: type II toxin-antitoxin system prevent-host-death family antitoxin [Rhodanobacter sp.]|nr:MAG: type II toxin-antitoxin system prevent-host-death family antitoxin [Rhodanobacter sp.]TAL90662.1 MAG: type II toxin-antitoxin system prevent-host-death family antitoxin [Rhodanobacter sp.]TAM43277.1 MAG: type II toxin-antitoxin system prevent-host-death family antitoxin [Rhodanobacter sp.]
MSTQIGSYEAKTRLPELLRQVRAGKSFTITNRGKAVAELVPIRDVSDEQATHAAKQMEAFMRSHRGRGVDIKALIEEGRR